VGVAPGRQQVVARIYLLKDIIVEQFLLEPQQHPVMDVLAAGELGVADFAFREVRQVSAEPGAGGELGFSTPGRSSGWRCGPGRRTATTFWAAGARLAESGKAQ
jgi:hypothetical protein